MRPLSMPQLNILAWLLLALGLVLPIPAFAQTHTLRVTIHDTSGQALADITVIVRAEDGQELARQVSSGEGAASFGELPAVVRVAVEGQARGGPRLYQLGDDGQGVRLDLGQAAGAASLDLRVEHDGLVLPDPATMLTLEEGGPTVEAPVALPTAVIATPAPLPTMGSHAAGIVTTGETAPSPEPRQDGWAPLATVLVIALAAGVMVLIQRRRDVQ